MRAVSEGATVQFQLLRRRAAKGCVALAFPRRIRNLAGEVVLVQEDEEVVQGPLVVWGTQGSDGEVWLVGEMAHSMDKPAQAAARRSGRGWNDDRERRLRHRGQWTFASKRDDASARLAAAASCPRNGASIRFL